MEPASIQKCRFGTGLIIPMYLIGALLRGVWRLLYTAAGGSLFSRSCKVIMDRERKSSFEEAE